MKQKHIHFHLVFCLLFLLRPSFLGQTSAINSMEANNIPGEYKTLYNELDNTLQTSIKKYTFEKSGKCPMFAPFMLIASSCYSPSLADSTGWKNIISILDAFKSLGAKAVMIEIMAPDLALGDSVSLIDFYRGFAREVHLRGMKLYIEHYVNIPFEPNFLPKSKKDFVMDRLKSLKDDPEGRQKFLNIIEQELTMIYRDIQPDYLSLLTEPLVSLIKVLKYAFTIDELTNWAGQVAADLKKIKISNKVLIGAGTLTYEPEKCVLGFAKQKDIDYIDFHLYSLNFRNVNQIAKLDTLIQKVRAIRPGMEIAIGETWLFKQGRSDPDAAYKDIFFRDNFSFWSPLDQEFLTLLMGIAQIENISVVVPFGSQYLFSYYMYGSEEAKILPPWPKNVRQSWNKAIEAIQHKQLSETGKVLRPLVGQ